MTGNEYQESALRTLNRTLNANDQLINGVMGLCGEAGEAADIVKKHLFQGHTLNTMHIVKELGDVLWYAAVTAYAIGYKLDDIMRMNKEKLEQRYPDRFDADMSINRKGGDI